MRRYLLVLIYMIITFSIIVAKDVIIDEKIFVGFSTVTDSDSLKALKLAKINALADMSRCISIGVYSSYENFLQEHDLESDDRMQTLIILISNTFVINPIYEIINESYHAGKFTYRIKCSKSKLDYFNECLRNPYIIDQDDRIDQLLEQEINKYKK